MGSSTPTFPPRSTATGFTSAPFLPAAASRGARVQSGGTLAGLRSRSEVRPIFTPVEAEVSLAIRAASRAQTSIAAGGPPCFIASPRRAWSAFWKARPDSWALSMAGPHAAGASARGTAGAGQDGGEDEGDEQGSLRGRVTEKDSSPAAAGGGVASGGPLWDKGAMSIVLYVAGVVLLAAGVAGLVLPVLPGAVLLVAGVVALAWAGNFAILGWAPWPSPG